MLKGFRSRCRQVLQKQGLSSLWKMTIPLMVYFSPQQHSLSSSRDTEILLFQQKAQTFLRQSLFDSALFYFHRSSRLALKKGDQNRYLILRLQTAGCYLRMGRHDSALRINRKVLNLSRKKNLHHPEMIAESALGQLAIKESRNGEALQHFTVSLSLARRLNNQHAIAYSQLNLGNTYSKLGLSKEAHAAFLEGLRQTDQNGSPHLKKSLVRGLVNVLEKEGNTDSSRLLLEKLNASLPEFPSSEQKIRHVMDRALYYKKAGALQQASRYYQIADNLAENTEMITVRIRSLKNRAEIALQSKQPEKAIQLAKETFRLTEKQTEKIFRPDLYQILYSAWKQTGTFDSALFYHEKLARSRQRVYEQIQKENLAEFRVKYQTDRTQKRLLELENDALLKDIELKTRQIQVNTLLGGGFTLVLIFSMMGVFFFYKQKKNKKIQQQIREKLFLEKEAEAARSLIMGEEKERQRIAQELHDGIGVLLSSASIFFSGFEEKIPPVNKTTARKIRGLLEQAGTEVHRISHNLMPVVLKRFGLIAALEDLLDDFSEKTGMVTRRNILLPHRMNEKKEIIIFRIVQELLHNTLKHSQANKVTFSLCKKQDIYQIKYTDNGRGFHVEVQQFQKGMGLPGIRNRIKLLDGTSKLITVPGKGFSLTILFPSH